jgi:hypothetical protein
MKIVMLPIDKDGTVRGHVDFYFSETGNEVVPHYNPKGLVGLDARSPGKYRYSRHVTVEEAGRLAGNIARRWAKAGYTVEQRVKA